MTPIPSAYLPCSGHNPNAGAALAFALPCAALQWRLAAADASLHACCSTVLQQHSNPSAEREEKDLDEEGIFHREERVSGCAAPWAPDRRTPATLPASLILWPTQSPGSGLSHQSTWVEASFHLNSLQVTTFRNRNLHMPEDADLSGASGDVRARYEDGVRAAGSCCLLRWLSDCPAGW